MGSRGSLILHAGKDITLDTDTLSARKDMTENRDNYIRTYRKTEMGNTLTAGKDITISAGGNLSARNSIMASESGKVTLAAGDDVTLSNGYNEARDDYGLKYKEKGFLSGKTATIKSHDEEKKASPAIISGDSVSILSGKDTGIAASQIIASHDVTAAAGGDIHISSAPEYESHDYEKQVKKRGLLSGGGLGFTVGSEKRKDRYDSTSLTHKGSMVGSAKGNVSLTSGKDMTLEASTLASGKDLTLTGKNVTITSKDNEYTNREEHEYKRSGLSVSLGGNLLNTVNSVVSPLTRAGEVKDRRLSALYGLEAGKNLKGAVSGYMDNVKTIESMKADVTRTDALRETVKVDGIATPMTERNLENIRDAEGKIMDKAKADNKARRSMSLDVSFGTAKAHSLSEERTIQAEGSTLHAKDTLTVKSGEDMTVKGSHMSAEDVYLKAGKDIHILSAENSSTTTEKENSSSASLGGSIGSSGLTGIRASYGRGREERMSEEISHTETTIKADHTLSLESGRDTILKGSRIEGEKVQADAGGSLSMESEQDRKTYRENGKNTGISLGYDIPSGKVSGLASAGKSHTDSDYESVTNQAGIYAGDKGFDITAKDNTYLKGAVIDSKGSADKNTLRTGTLSWEDVENKADYKAGSTGITYAPKDSTMPLNARGLTPQMSPTVKDKAGSSTKAAIAKGTIVITDKKNQKQDISTLNRDTENSLNKLKEIFDKSKVEEKQELIRKFSRISAEEIGKVASQKGWKDSDYRRMLLHGALGGIIARLGGSNVISGMSAGAAMERIQPVLDHFLTNHPDMREMISIVVGYAAGHLTGSDGKIGAEAALNGTKFNWLNEEQMNQWSEEYRNAKTEAEKERVIAKWKKINDAQGDDWLGKQGKGFYIDLTLNKGVLLRGNGNDSDKVDEHKEGAFDWKSSLATTVIGEEAGLPWALREKYGGRGFIRVLGKYNLIGVGISGTLDLANDYKDYSGRDFLIASLIDVEKTGAGIIIGSWNPYIGFISAPFLDKWAETVKENKLTSAAKKREAN